jgi:hypothetical protein
MTFPHTTLAGKPYIAISKVNPRINFIVQRTLPEMLSLGIPDEKHYPHCSPRCWYLTRYRRRRSDDCDLSKLTSVVVLFISRQEHCWLSHGERFAVAAKGERAHTIGINRTTFPSGK